jgi:predicted nuclease with TOPRIM domain
VEKVYICELTKEELDQLPRSRMEESKGFGINEQTYIHIPMHYFKELKCKECPKCTHCSDIKIENQKLRDKLKLESERNKSFENVRQLLYKEAKELNKEIKELKGWNKTWKESLNIANAEIAQVKTENQKLRETLYETTQVLQQEYENIVKRIDIKAPEDLAVKELCEKHGYGAVLDSTARQWYLRYGNSSQVTGECMVTVINIVKSAKQALQEPTNENPQ